MLTKQTKNFLSNYVKLSSHFQPTYFIPSQSSTGLSSTGIIPLNQNMLHCSFSTSNNSHKKSGEDQTDHPKNENQAENSLEKVIKRKRAKKQIAEPLEAQQFDKVEERKLKSVPIRPSKFPLEKDEESQKLETYVLFSSATPIIPFCQQSGTVKPVNLVANHISNKLAYFIQNERGEVYTIGLVLENNVNKSLKDNSSEASKTKTEAQDQKNKTKPNLSVKSKNFKVKLAEIEFKDNCIFGKGIPYKDSKLTAEEKKVNIQAVLGQIKSLALAIKQSVTHEKIEVFNNISFDQIDSKNFDHEKLDELLYQILGDCHKLTGYTKEGLQQFIQAFLEQRSIISRMFMMKRKLEEVKSVLEIVTKSIQYADEQIWKYHEQAKAKLSLDYIRSKYFNGDSINATPKANASGASQNQNQNPASHLSGPAKKFMDKLNFIKDEVSREKVRKEIERFNLQDKQSADYHKLFTYLDEVFSIPWGKYSEEHWDIDYSKKVLEQQLFGLDKVKERITEMIAVNKLKRIKSNSSEKKKGLVIMLNGPPGTGKTTIAKTIAKALKRESRFISFAGVTDPAFVKGHKRTYLDAQPGVFVKELIKSKVMNPVFILDEVDKLSKQQQGGDPYYALMEILNPEENNNFTDHFLDIKVDFSQVVFILTSNQMFNMLEPLRNRLEIIDVPAYIEQEKMSIAKNHLIPAVLDENGLPQNSINFDDESVRRIIKGWCYYESGVRELKRCFEKIARKHAREILDTHSIKFPNQVETETIQPFVIPTTPLESYISPEIPSRPVDGQFAAVDVLVNEGPLLANSLEAGEVGVMNAAAEGQTMDISNRSTSEGADFQKQSSDSSGVPVSTEKIDSKETSQLIEVRDSAKLIFDSSKDEEEENLKKYLGMPIFDDHQLRKFKKTIPGTANILTVSGFIGHVLSVECVYDMSQVDKRGGLFTSSGNLQRVLQESLTIARINAARFLTPEKIKEVSDKNVHIHFLSGSSPKDGPSAGLSICSAYLSLIMNKSVPADISMTGELSLNGEVCRIGGVQAKVTASKALDIKRIILPWGNKVDFIELPKMLQEGLTVYFVKEYKEVFNIIFGDDPKLLDSIEKCVNGQFLLPIQLPAEGTTISNAL
jgi:Lon-like ATP-dependent protease